MTKLVQIFLPLSDNRGRRFPRAHFATVREELAEKFGGLTAYARAPARGVWKTSGRTQRDDIVILEVMTARIANAWWSRYREVLERRFEQDQIIVRVQDVRLL